MISPFQVDRFVSAVELLAHSLDRIARCFEVIEHSARHDDDETRDGAIPLDDTKFEDIDLEDVFSTTEELI
jgi:hypothetical protein